MEQVSAQVKEIKKLVEQNQDTLLALHTNRDKPDIFNDLFRKLRSKITEYILHCIYDAVLCMCVMPACFLSCSFK